MSAFPIPWVEAEARIGIASSRKEWGNPLLLQGIFLYFCQIWSSGFLFSSSRWWKLVDSEWLLGLCGISKRSWEKVTERHWLRRPCCAQQFLFCFHGVSLLFFHLKWEKMTFSVSCQQPFVLHSVIHSITSSSHWLLWRCCFSWLLHRLLEVKWIFKKIWGFALKYWQLKWATNTCIINYNI